MFITAYDEHAVPAFEEGAVDFLLKPLSVERLRRTVARLRARIAEAPAVLEPLLAGLREALERPPTLRWISVLEGRELRAILSVRRSAGGAMESVLRDHPDRIPVSQPYAHRFRQM